MSAQHEEDYGLSRSTEAPLSSNFYWTFGRGEVFNIQTTIREGIHPEQLEVHLESLKEAMLKVIEMGGHAKPVGQQPAPRPDPAYAGSAENHPTPPASQNGNGQAHCLMIEVGTSYSGGKTQLSFTCDGMEHPLRYTKAIGEMVKLMQPLGWTSEMIVVGKKYPANCTVNYSTTERDGKNYKNVLSVQAR